MTIRRLTALLPVLLALAVGLLVRPGGAARARAEEPSREKLETHPMRDARPGEYLRYVVETDGWKKYYIERILDVREEEVLLEIAQTSEDGTKDQQIVYRRWRPFPKLKPNRRQEIVKDEMVELEVDGKKLWCRYYEINEREHIDWPDPVHRKEVWYSNDVPCSGKVKDTLAGRLVTSWGMMSPDETAKRKKAFEDAQKGSQPAPHK